MAPAKRVGLFLSRNMPQHLTDDGWTLFDSAVTFLLKLGDVASALPACSADMMVSKGCTKCMGSSQPGCCTLGLESRLGTLDCAGTACYNGGTKQCTVNSACDARNVPVPSTFKPAVCTVNDGPKDKDTNKGICLNCKDGEWCCKETGSCFAANHWCPNTACGAAGKCTTANVCKKVTPTGCPGWTHRLTFTNSSKETV
jgi:hypothetical protein